MDKKKYKHTPDEAGYLKIETFRSGPFIFQIGLDMSILDSFRLRVEDVYTRFINMPLFPDITNNLEHIVLVSSAYGTNTIEGATISEIETEAALNLTPEQVKDEQSQRVVNIKNALQYAHEIANKFQETFNHSNNNPHLHLNEKIIRELHKIITDELKIPNNTPGQYRNNPKGFYTKVGDKEHGGIYTPPKCLDDIEILMAAFCNWANSDSILKLSPLFRASLIHYYFELIHPFNDGNGRTGRLIENMLLEAAGYKYSAHIWRLYYEDIHQYFTLFNTCRESAKKHITYPNTEFVKFFLHNMLNTVNYLQDKSYELIAVLNFSNYVNSLVANKTINHRQELIIRYLTNNLQIDSKKKLQSQDWYASIYKKMSTKTKERDLLQLISLNLININKEGIISTSNLKPKTKLFKNPKTSF